VILRAVLLTLAFVVVVVVLAAVFSTVYTTLDYSLNAVGGFIPVDRRFVDTTFGYLRGVAWLVVLAAVAVFVVYAVHTRRR
jgi:type IV secretory pathway VirB6-like protein